MTPQRARNTILGLCLLVSMPAVAAEIITKEDLVKKVVRVEQLIRLTDNAIFLIDTSSSMNEKYRDTGKSRLEALVGEFKDRNTYLPDLGYNFGLYVYTPWKPIYGLTPFDRAGVAKALDALPALKVIE